MYLKQKYLFWILNLIMKTFIWNNNAYNIRNWTTTQGWMKQKKNIFTHSVANTDLGITVDY